MKTIAPVLFCALCLLSCTGDQLVKKYGKEFNRVRLATGLPALPDSWHLYKNDAARHGISYIAWSKGKNDRTYYATKTIVCTKNEIISETNVFYGTEKYKNIDGTYTEELEVTCNFIDYHDGQVEQVKGWECTLSSKEYPNAPHQVSKIEADSIIGSWRQH